MSPATAGAVRPRRNGKAKKGCPLGAECELASGVTVLAAKIDGLSTLVNGLSGRVYQLSQHVVATDQREHEWEQLLGNVEGIAQRAVQGVRAEIMALIDHEVSRRLGPRE